MASQSGFRVIARKMGRLAELRCAASFDIYDAGPIAVLVSSLIIRAGKDFERMPEKYQDMEDAQIVALAQAGDEQASEYIMNKYKNLVRSKAHAYFIMGAEAEDLLQEGMIGLFKAIRDYDKDKNDSFYAFAVMCIRRQLISALKRATRQKHIPLNSYVSLNKSIYDEENERTLMDVLTARGVSNPEQLMIAQQEYEFINAKIENVLSDFERAVLKEYIVGKSYSDIASGMNTQTKSVDNALQRVKAKLERALRSIM